jgi:hypothetical protein
MWLLTEVGHEMNRNGPRRLRWYLVRVHDLGCRPISHFPLILEEQKGVKNISKKRRKKHLKKKGVKRRQVSPPLPIAGGLTTAAASNKHARPCLHHGALPPSKSTARSISRWLLPAAWHHCHLLCSVSSSRSNFFV